VNPPSVPEQPQTFDNADIGSGTIIEAQVHVGVRYHPDCGRAIVGAESILRLGTVIYGDVKVGKYFQTGHYTVVRARVNAGDYCALGNHSVLEGMVELGEGVRIMSMVYIPSRTRIGNHVFIGPGTTFLNDKLPGRLEVMKSPLGATIEDEVMIGGGCVILPGIRIGTQSFIAAGTLVTRDVPPHTLAIGSPAEHRPLPAAIDRPNNRGLTRPPLDLWHPKTPDLSTIRW